MKAQELTKATTGLSIVQYEKQSVFTAAGESLYNGAKRVMHSEKNFGVIFANCG